MYLCNVSREILIVLAKLQDLWEVRRLSRPHDERQRLSQQEAAASSHVHCRHDVYMQVDDMCVVL